MATFTGQAATNNTFIGSAAADTFLFAAADLTALDTLTGGGGADLLQLTTAGLLPIDALAGMTGIATVQLAAGANSLTFLNNNLTGVTGARITVFGASGADTIDASGLTGANAVDIRSGAGLDVLKGGSGADTFRFAAADLAGDTVIGGAGADVLVISTAGVLGATALSGVSGVETISLTAGTNGVTLVNGNLTGLGGARINVIGTSGADTLDGSGLTGTNAAIFVAGSGLDVLRGGAGADVFRFAAADIAGDTVVGGAGSDTLEISTAGLLGAAALSGVSGVETITLAAGTNSLTLLNSNLTGVAGSRITVQGNSGADTIDASGVTDSSASVLFNSGAGLDVLRGGAGADTFRLAATDLAGDTVAGGAGSDTLQISTAGVLSNTALSGVSGVETISLTAGTNRLTVLNSNLTDVSGNTITIFGASGADTIDGSGLTGSNALDIRAGTGLDVLQGGAGADTFRFAAGELDGDTVIGGTGTDVLAISTAGVLGTAAMSGVSGVETITLTAGTNGLTLVNGNLAGLGGARINVIGTSGADTLDGSGLTGTNAAIFVAGSGLDVLRGGAGADVFRFDAAELAGDTVVGGAGSDTLEMTSAGVLGATALSGVSGVERINLATGTNSLKLLDSNLTGLASSQITVQGNSGADTIDASGLTSTTSSVLFIAGAGIDVLKGGAGADVFRFAATDLSGDTISGGAEVDRLEITTAGTITAAAIAGMTGVETIALTFGTNSIALTNSNFTDTEGSAIDIFGASGNDTIDGSAVTGNNSLAFYAGAGQDTLLGGAGNDFFVFDAINLTGDTISGGGGDDTLILQTRGSTVANGLTQMTGVENVTLSARGNGVTLVDGNFTGVAGRVISVTGGAGNDTVDASRLGAANGVTITAGGGNDLLKGGAGADVFIFTGTNLTDADIVDGGAGADVLRFDRTTSLLGNSIRNVENLTYTGVGNLAMTISGANASRLSSIGAAAADGFTQTFTVQLSNGSTTDLSRLELSNRDAADKIVVVSTGGDTAVTTSREISGFTGTADNDTLSGYYRNGAVINGGGGDDRLAYDPAATGIRLDGGEGNDTLVLQDQVGRPVNLDGQYSYVYHPEDGSNSYQWELNQIIYEYYDNTPENAPFLNLVTNFENVDASATTTGVDITGRTDVSSYLIGGSGYDVIVGSAGATILGGLGGDYLQSDGSARYLVRNTAEADGDAFYSGKIQLLGETDLRGAYFEVFELALAAGTFTGTSVTPVNADLSATVADYQIYYGLISTISGNPAFANTTETLTVTVSDALVDFSSINFQNWSGNDNLNIIGLDPGDDTIIGSTGKDVISGLGGADIIYGRGGSDLINGGTENDSLWGEGDNDTINGDDGADTLSGGDGNDAVNGGAGEDLITGDSGNDTLTGGAGNDRFEYRSTAEATGDSIDGQGDVDTIALRGSIDLTATTISNVEALTLAATDDSGNLIGSGLTATLTGTQVQALKTVSGNSGFANSTEKLLVQVGAAALSFSNITFKDWSGTDNVEIIGTDGNTVVDASALTAGNVVTFNTGAGIDALQGGAGADSFTFRVADLAGDDQILGNGGTDTLNLSTAGALLSAALIGMSGVENIVLNSGGNSIALSDNNFLGVSGGVITVTGSNSSDLIVNSALNPNSALAITAGGGQDMLFGGAGADVFTFFASDLTSADIINAGGGIDTLQLQGSGGVQSTALENTMGVERIVLLDGVNSVTLRDYNFNNLSGFTITVIGNNTSDTIDGSAVTSGRSIDMTGGNGFDVLKGGSGFDRIVGGFGTDQLTGGFGQDMFVWNARQEGGDRITDFTRGQDKLVFGSNAFLVNGVFDYLVVDTVSVADNLSLADLFLTNATLDNTAQVRSYINNENSVTPHGMFIIAANSAGSNILYYTSDASTTAGTGLDKAVYQIADLGMGTITPAIMSDFLFI